MAVEPIVQLKDVSFTYPGAESPVLHNIHLTINPGEFTAIVGGNGSGKSTLCKTFNGLIPQFYVGDFEGEVIVNGLLAKDHSVAQLSQNVGYVYQDFENQLLRPTVLDDVCFVPLNYGLADYKERGQWALEVTGLSDLHNEFIWQLSGGQMHLLALAGALAMKPKMIIIDEPIAQLDPNHAKQVYDILKTLNVDYGITIIVIEHHTEFIANYCDQVILMDQGRILWKKAVKEALSQVEELMGRQIYPPQVTQAAYSLRSASKVENSYPTTIDEAIDYFPKLPSTHQLPSLATKNERIALGSVKDLVIQIKDVSLHYRTFKKKSKQVLKGINVSFHKGDLVAVVGNNGAGKSSLLKLIVGIVKPKEGDVIVQGMNTRKASPEKLSDIVSYVYQNPEEMFINDSVRKDIEYYLKVRKVPNYTAVVDQLIEDFSLVDIQHHDARLLSGGQQRRASLAIGAAMNPAVILLDEPTANLDIATKKQMIHMLSKLRQHVQTVIVATHDMQLVSEWSNRVIVMNHGKIVSDGDRSSLFADDELVERAGLATPQILQLSHKLGMNPVCFTVEDFIAGWRSVDKERVNLGLYKEYA
jgi:energy-coupling factor transporter ATP-binding protein EcfA2